MDYHLLRFILHQQPMNKKKKRYFEKKVNMLWNIKNNEKKIMFYCITYLACLK